MPGSGRTLAITSSWTRSSGTLPSTAVPRKPGDNIRDLGSGNPVRGLRPNSGCEAWADWTFFSGGKRGGEGPFFRSFEPGSRQGPRGYRIMSYMPASGRTLAIRQN
ncbi:hypothetical protein EYF80_064466 [Liparis tanakae]|uniref:Uncharacterized protein n=1 Tax=Liparis tanakae TaxID=230148 RepID=A0A4Z2E9H0_9TELE|nr:hypothetical protein EYF80_064466 [Liparis tanakae]